MRQSIFLLVWIALLTSCGNNSDRQKPSNTSPAKPQRPALINITPPVPICSPVASDSSWYASDKKAPLFEGLDVYSFPITTEDSLAQRYFNQGLVLAYGFNHAESARSFYQAIREDSTCAMCHWGYAYVLGPNYNAGMEKDNFEKAYQASQKALELSENTTEIEQVLIQAMAHRYAENPPENRHALDSAYADALKAVFQTFPENADVGTFYAEALMDMHPWDLWNHERNAMPWTPKILNILDSTLAIDSLHPGANHLYMHAVEASKYPQKGLFSAKLFDQGLVPGSGHLMHMPSHVYIRTGHYHRGSVANVKAVEVDSLYLARCYAKGIYPLGYVPHNYHFLSATATLEGNSQWALESADLLSENMNRELMKAPEFATLQHYYLIPYHVYLKFGQWDKVLEWELADSTLAYPKAIRHYARGMALLAKGQTEEAEKELELLKETAKDTSLQHMTIWEVNPISMVVEIAQNVLAGEIQASMGNYQKSVEFLTKAVDIETQLKYNEPPDWFFSVRHHLGAVQLEAGQYEEAIQTYQDDLKNWPNNGWALKGMEIAYEKLDDQEQLKTTQQQFLKSWQYADVEINSSRLK